MAVTVVGGTSRRKQSPTFGLALAGGGPLGGVYEVGVLSALDEALEGVDLHEMGVYVGVSAGAFVAACLANGFSTAQIARILVAGESMEHPVSRGIFLQPAWREYLRSLLRAPGAVNSVLVDFLRRPLDTGLSGALANLTRLLPNGLLDNDPIEGFLGDLFRTRGCTNDFRELSRRLNVVAAVLDTGESVVFGSPGHDHVAISRAVQASTALPGLYPPVKIEGRYFVDGALRRTLHASVALEQGADLLLCINPIVPYDASLAPDDGPRRHVNLTDGGLPVVLSQTMRSLIHSRMRVGIKSYDTLFEDRSVVLFEPDRADSRMFFTNLFSYSNRRRIGQHAYQTTRRDLLQNYEELSTLFARHGVRLRRDVLLDSRRHFDTAMSVSPEMRSRGRYKNEVTNRLSATLDRLQQELGS